jgi:hypothetical protein
LLPADILARRIFWRACPPCFLSAVFMAEWRAVLGKSDCCEEKYKQIIICEANKVLHLGFPKTTYYLTIIQKDWTLLDFTKVLTINTSLVILLKKIKTYK